jgi:hypothetical protein
MELLHRQIAQAERRGDLTFADILRDTVNDLKRHDLAVRVRKERLRNIKLVDQDY